MNMLIRFFIMMALLNMQLKQPTSSQSAKPQTATNDILFKPISRCYRILPHDMGFRNHLPNYRYLSFIELNITNWLMQMSQQMGLNTAKNKLNWIIAMQEMVYLKQIKFLDKITVTSQLAGWDKKYVYFTHHFFVKQTLMATGMTKFVLMDDTKKASPTVLGMTGERLTNVINTWNAHQHAIKSQ